MLLVMIAALWEVGSVTEGGAFTVNNKSDAVGCEPW